MNPRAKGLLIRLGVVLTSWACAAVCSVISSWVWNRYHSLELRVLFAISSAVFGIGSLVALLSMVWYVYRQDCERIKRFFSN